MVSPDEVNPYAQYPDLIRKVEHLRSLLRHPADQALLSEVLFELKSYDILKGTISNPSKN